MGEQAGGDEARVKYALSSLLPGAVAGVGGDFSDVVVIVGPREAPCEFGLHRCVLALASPVFRAMLSADMVERRTGRISLRHFSSDAMALAVRHMYGVEVEETFGAETAFQLYSFAHQFDISTLLPLARRTLLAALAVETCVAAASFALLHEDDELYQASLDFIAHGFTDMTSSPDALDMLCRLPERAMYAVLDSDKVRAMEMDILRAALRWVSGARVAARTREVLARIRWGLMTADMLDVVQGSGIASLSPAAGQLIQECRLRLETDADDRRGLTAVSRARFFGRPSATVWVPLLRRPAAAFRAAGKRARGSAPEGEPWVGARFEQHGLRWSVRARARRCDSAGCSCALVAASLWLEEGEDGRLWRARGEQGRRLPLRVEARWAVWDGQGGKVASQTLAASFRAAGWACGWSVEERVLGGAGGGVRVAVEVCRVRGDGEASLSEE